MYPLALPSLDLVLAHRYASPCIARVLISHFPVRSVSINTAAALATAATAAASRGGGDADDGDGDDDDYEALAHSDDDDDDDDDDGGVRRMRIATMVTIHPFTDDSDGVVDDFGNDDADQKCP